MRSREEIQKEIEALEKRRWLEEMADDSFYIDGRAKEYDHELYLLKKELRELPQN